jgi:hypothetical protein
MGEDWGMKLYNELLRILIKALQVTHSWNGSDAPEHDYHLVVLQHELEQALNTLMRIRAAEPRKEAE